jgi:predicted Rossmann fold nucleotide-binding protein DprA/Smf involved in DNA uptake
VDALDDAARPVALFAYGNLDALAQPSLAFLARPPLPGPAFEQAQTVARAALARGLGLALGAAHGFDLALLKIAADARVPSVAVLGCGLGKLAPSFRPAATMLVRAGGLLLSPFPMDHGPFEHDDDERARVQAALGRAVCAVALPDAGPEARAAAWAAAHDATRFCTIGAAPGAPGTSLDAQTETKAFLDTLAS